MSEPTEDGEVLSIITMADGEAIRQLDEAIDAVWKNIEDRNTEATAKREVTLKITFQSDSDREVVLVGMKVDTKLQGQAGVASKILLGYSGGHLAASEIRCRQTTIEDHVANVLSITKDKNGKDQK